MTKAQVKRVLGGQPDAVHGEGSGHEFWITTTLAGDVQQDAISEGVFQAMSGLGLFGSPVRRVADRNLPKKTTYEIYFDGDRVVGVMVSRG